MHLLAHGVALLALLLATTRADLTCLKWDLLLNPIGLICHFKPSFYIKLVESAEAAVDATRTAVTDLVHFDLTHHPAAVAYQYAQNAEADGILQANQGLINVTKDFAQVGIGFEKDLVNTGVQIFNLLDWSDVTRCIIKESASAEPSRAVLPLVLDTAFPVQNIAALKRWGDCTKEKFSKPLVYNITEPDQKVGASIAEIATLLIPVGAPADAGANAVKLALPGSEDSIEIFKIGTNPTKGEFFEDAVEGQGVADALQDPEYEKTRCSACSAPYGAIFSRRLLRRTFSITALCCQSVSDLPTSDDPPTRERLIVKPPSMEDLSQAPEFTPQDANLRTGLKDLQQDLFDYGTGEFKICHELDTLVDSTLASIRKIATGSPFEADYQTLQFSTGMRIERLTSHSSTWDQVTYQRLPYLKKLKKQLEKTLLPMTARLQGCSAWRLKLNIEFFYYYPDQGPHMEYHWDPNVFTFAAADTPGLIIRAPPRTVVSDGRLLTFKVPVKPDSIFGFPGGFFAGKAHGQRIPMTMHAVMDPKMEQTGRMSMVVNVKRRW